MLRIFPWVHVQFCTPTSWCHDSLIRKVHGNLETWHHCICVITCKIEVYGLCILQACLHAAILKACYLKRALQGSLTDFLSLPCFAHTGTQTSGSAQKAACNPEHSTPLHRLCAALSSGATSSFLQGYRAAIAG